MNANQEKRTMWLPDSWGMLGVSSFDLFTPRPNATEPSSTRTFLAAPLGNSNNEDEENDLSREEQDSDDDSNDSFYDVPKWRLHPVVESRLGAGANAVQELANMYTSKQQAREFVLDHLGIEAQTILAETNGKVFEDNDSNESLPSEEFIDENKLIN